ncbi:MAG TPA: MaoC/PaaZ C-terminal domain-containing protein, partial [Reyranella sp.]|nr:MaoC/PaaZ C-terminal domain-containing protein [Reyranella sp.]
MTTIPKFDQVKVGDELKPLVLPPVSRHQLALYCGGSGDHNPIHVDSEFARSVGLPGTIAHGLLDMAILTDSPIQ